LSKPPLFMFRLYSLGTPALTRTSEASRRLI
jgi:hypothetical protein